MHCMSYDKILTPNQLHLYSRLSRRHLSQMYAIIQRDHGVNGTMVEGTFFVNSFPAKILSDLQHLILSYLSHSSEECT